MVLRFGYTKPLWALEIYDQRHLSGCKKPRKTRSQLASEFQIVCVQNGSTDGNFVGISITFAVYMYVSNIIGLSLSLSLNTFDISHIRNFCQRSFLKNQQHR